MFNINIRLNRCAKIWNLLLDQLQLLETMTPIEFLEFRDFITPASGFQSLQFRIIEFKLGLSDKSRKPSSDSNHGFDQKYFTQTMFKNHQSDELKKVADEQSLLVLLEVNTYSETNFDIA
jgi:tryptophan 2,3-dioxygenase